MNTFEQEKNQSLSLIIQKPLIHIKNNSDFMNFVDVKLVNSSVWKSVVTLLSIYNYFRDLQEEENVIM